MGSTVGNIRFLQSTSIFFTVPGFLLTARDPGFWRSVLDQSYVAVDHKFEKKKNRSHTRIQSRAMRFRETNLANMITDNSLYNYYKKNILFRKILLSYGAYSLKVLSFRESPFNFYILSLFRASFSCSIQNIFICQVILTYGVYVICNSNLV